MLYLRNLNQKRSHKMNVNEDETHMTQREVAEALGMNRGLVHYIEKVAIAKVKKELKKRNIDAKLLFKDTK